MQFSFSLSFLPVELHPLPSFLWTCIPSSVVKDQTDRYTYSFFNNLWLKRPTKKILLPLPFHIYLSRLGWVILCIQCIFIRLWSSQPQFFKSLLNFALALLSILLDILMLPSNLICESQKDGWQLCVSSPNHLCLQKLTWPCLSIFIANFESDISVEVWFLHDTPPHSLLPLKYYTCPPSLSSFTPLCLFLFPNSPT